MSLLLWDRPLRQGQIRQMWMLMYRQRIIDLLKKWQRQYQTLIELVADKSLMLIIVERALFLKNNLLPAKHSRILVEMVHKELFYRQTAE